MARQWFDKIKEALFAIIPIVVIVLVLHFTGLAHLTNNELYPFLGAAFFMILGLILFNMGADSAITKMGDHIGATLTKRGNIFTIIIVAFCIGTFVTLAEPDVQFLSGQVPVNTWLFAGLIGIGVGLFLVAGLLRIIFKKNLEVWFIIFYGLVFAIASLYVQKTDNLAYISLAFDAGGVTTGSLTVPFIMALGAAMANVRGGNKKQADSFGLIALCSIGPIIMILLLGLFAQGNGSYVPRSPNGFWESLFVNYKNVTFSLIPIVIFFFAYEVLFIKLPVKQVLKIVIGIIYTYIGLVLFLAAIDYGFFPVGKAIGKEIGSLALSSGLNWIIILIGVILGMVSAIAEPAIYVLNKQVEEISGGTISRKKMLVGIALGIGLSVALSMIRLLYDINILYFLVPGYILAITLSFVVPNIYTAVAFDSGGAASGMMTATFILPFAIGICTTFYAAQNPSDLNNTITQNAFGMVAMVAMTPIVVVQLLGFNSLMKENSRRRMARARVREVFDDQIINFI